MFALISLWTLLAKQMGFTGGKILLLLLCVVVLAERVRRLCAPQPHDLFYRWEICFSYWLTTHARKEKVLLWTASFHLRVCMYVAIYMHCVWERSKNHFSATASHWSFEAPKMMFGTAVIKSLDQLDHRPKPRWATRHEVRIANDQHVVGTCWSADANTKNAWGRGQREVSFVLRSKEKEKSPLILYLSTCHHCVYSQKNSMLSFLAAWLFPPDWASTYEETEEKIPTAG